MKKYIFLDVETTGLSPHKGDRIIEIGCVEVINGFLTGRVFHSYFKNNAEISIEAFQIHGINKNFLQDKPFFYEKIDDFLGFINNSIIVAHNAKFDVNFLHYEINQCGGDADEFYEKNFFLDSLEIARKMFPKQRNDLDSLCKRFNILNNFLREKHSALIDAWLLALVINKMGFFEKKKDE
ncbi:DNA polymerase III subunit epsilon [Candidatus Carsonella ruddii]|uniref:DNA polymerase III subunit epsilon n=2 Tax=cellular organisms TaxID=131567 RepID=A0AAJ6FCA0_CARRU|nr:DNA polymerase III subunit epsilon [Candidatus Carsonella ruddii]WGS66578.1 DNA polymerase III subunit epsilon [Candidatus Carsonella ruddii]WGS66776.1 DNA polymerase III subunit epsilon [Candidatus Carsonella ruddii]WGS66967.1 DNA polymerase III subunit epsilon [Candidatus Carsonella ruddii]WGS67159.1 DNA polymerase III subunit epsilon [Candidatus Carsonella ruddii]WMC18174.1 MAG: DNA polymerase III subunit epsilon [Candidatus Carsonella ruddii]